MLLGHLLPQQGSCEIALNCFLLCVVLWEPYTFSNLDCNHEEKRLFGSHNH